MGSPSLRAGEKVAELSRRLAPLVTTLFHGRGLLADSTPRWSAPTYGGCRPAGSDASGRGFRLFLLGVILSDTNFAVSEKKIDLRKPSSPARRPEVRRPSRVSGDPAGSAGRGVAGAHRRAGTSGGSLPYGVSAGSAGRRAKTIAPNDIAVAVQRPDGRTRQAADRLRHGRLPVPPRWTSTHRAGGARLLRHHGLRRAGRPGRAGSDRAAAADPGRRRRLPDDRLGTGQLPPLRLGSDRALFNNASWEMLRTFQPESGFNNLDDWGFAAMAAGMGGEGVRVATRRELKAALDKAIATRGSFPVDRDHDPARRAVADAATLCRRGEAAERGKIDRNDNKGEKTP